MNEKDHWVAFLPDFHESLREPPTLIACQSPPRGSWSTNMYAYRWYFPVPLVPRTSPPKTVLACIRACVHECLLACLQFALGILKMSVCVSNPWPSGRASRQTGGTGTHTHTHLRLSSSNAAENERTQSPKTSRFPIVLPGRPTPTA